MTTNADAQNKAGPAPQPGTHMLEERSRVRPDQQREGLDPFR